MPPGAGSARADVLAWTGMRDTVVRARGLAEELMADALPRRWGHVQSVAAKAEGLRRALGDDADLLVVSAWLHDIGYAPTLADTGFHPLDGARYLADLGADRRVCCLVANHSGAAVEAHLRGFGEEMADFPDERSLARDALWYCDMTTGPTGLPVTFDDRLVEICERYGPNHTVPRAISASASEIRAAIGRVERGTGSTGVPGGQPSARPESDDSEQQTNAGRVR